MTKKCIKNRVTYKESFFQTNHLLVIILTIKQQREKIRLYLSDI